MNDKGRRYIIEQMNKHDDRRSRDSREERDYENDYEDGGYYDQLDERRGVRGSGRRRRMDRRDYEDGEDYHHGHEMRLTKSDMTKWKREMENTDGTKGAHYDMQQVMQAAEKLGVKFHDFSEKELCLATNIIYSDFGQVIKRAVGEDKTLIVCTDMGVAYLDDPDGYEASEKLAIHYHCMMNFE